MTTKDMYLRACARRPMEINEFLTALGDVVRTLQGRYPEGLFCEAGGHVTVPQGLEEESGLPPCYDGAVILAAVAAKDGGAALQKRAEDALEAVVRLRWREAAAGARITHTGGGRL